jgi:hypothetical protein
MLVLTGPLSSLLGVPPELLRFAGVSLIPFAAFVTWICTRPTLPRLPVRAVIALNVGWVIGSAWLLFADRIDPNQFGVAFIVVQAIAVAVLAEMRYAGLRRQVPSAP